MQVFKHKALKRYAALLLGYSRTELDTAIKGGALAIMDKSILDTIHQSAKELHDAGVMSDITLCEFDALCLPQIKTYSPAQIKRIRQKTRASQAVFAAYLNTSLSTVQKWEIGGKKPNGPSLKLLNLVDQKGLEALA